MKCSNKSQCSCCCIVCVLLCAGTAVLIVRKDVITAWPGNIYYILYICCHTCVKVALIFGGLLHTSFGIAAPKIWNSLPLALQMCTSLIPNFVVCFRPNFFSMLSNPLNAFFLRFRFCCWPFCAFINSVYLLTYIVNTGILVGIVWRVSRAFWKCLLHRCCWLAWGKCLTCFVLAAGESMVSKLLLSTV